jgi:hypothetical protein
MRYRLVIIIAFALSTVLPALAAEPTLSLKDLISQHLDSIGTPEQRAAVKTRVAQGTSHYKILNGGAGELNGPATFLGEGKNLRIVMRYPTGEYRGEDFLTDGSRVQVFGNPKRSLMGQLLYDQGALITEGILGGTLTPAWPLLDPKVRDAKLSYEGLKTIDGTTLHEVKYVPKKKSDLDIRLYFDRETFRHVLTIATATINPKLMGAVGGDGADFMDRGPAYAVGADNGTNAETSTSRQQTFRYRIEQRFEDFQKVDGMMLPHKSSIRFSAEGYRSALVTYDASFSDLNTNISLDPKNFQFK